METTHEMHRMGEKNSDHRKQLRDDGIKLELRIFGKMGKDLRGTPLWSSKYEMTTRNTTTNCLDTPGESKAKRLSQR